MESTQAQVAVEPAEPRTIRHCPKCGADQALDRFYRSPKKASGFLSWCKSCYAERERTDEYRGYRRRYMQGYYRANAPYREKALKRAKTDEAKVRRRRLKRTDKFRRTRNEQNAHMTPEKRNWLRVYRRGYDRVHRTKKYARLLTSLMRRFGYLLPEPCARCGNTEVIIHHLDYTKPLDILWLCRPCHVLVHHPLPPTI